MTYLYKASVYSYYIEEQIKKKNGNLTEITEISSQSIISKAEQSEIIEIKDEIPTPEEDDPLKYYNRPFTYEIPLAVQQEFKTRQNKFGPFMPSIKEDKFLSKNPGLMHSESSIIALSENNSSNSNEEKLFSFEKRNKFSSENFSLQTIIEKPIEFEEKIGFKSFVILKQLGSGSFGKVFLVTF